MTGHYSWNANDLRPFSGAEQPLMPGEGAQANKKRERTREGWVRRAEADICARPLAPALPDGFRCDRLAAAK